MSEKIARLRWQCRRGMLELDAILQPFIDKGFSALTNEEQQDFENLLAYEDPILYAWLVGFEQPREPALLRIVEFIRQVITRP